MPPNTTLRGSGQSASAKHYTTQTNRKPKCTIIIESDKDIKHLNKLKTVADKYNITIELIDEGRSK